MSIDATSASFLGLGHGWADLQPWRSLTTGRPAVLGEPWSARRAGELAARLVGAEGGLVARSTLHALTDVLSTLPGRGDTVAVDAAAYPLAHWAAAVGTGGAGMTVYPHHDPPRHGGRGRRFAVTDGWCPGCGRPAPLAGLRAWVGAGTPGGAVVVDDSLAFGVLGARAGVAAGFGDGGGTARWCGLDAAGLIVVASTAKAFGAALTVVTGGAHHLGPLATAGNRVHSSPPSAADLAAAVAALGDVPRAAERRRRLWGHVMTVRRALRAAGRTVVGLPFPVVAVACPDVAAARATWAEVRDGGVAAVVQLPRCRPGALVSVLLRADHSPAEVARIAAVLTGARTARWAS